MTQFSDIPAEFIGFGPQTNGHLWMISEAAKIFDKLIFAVGINSNKKYTFSVDDMIGMLKSITKGMKNKDCNNL